MKKLIAAALVACTASSAFAWGDREQGALVGIASILLLQNMQRQNQAVYPPNYPVVTAPVPPIIQPIPQYPGYYVPAPRRPVCTVRVDSHVDHFGNIFYTQRLVCL